MVDFQGVFGYLQKKFKESPDPYRVYPNKNQAGGYQQKAYMKTFDKTALNEQFRYFRNEFGLTFAFHPMIKGKNVAVNCTPDLLIGIQSLNEYVDNYYIA